MSLSETKKYRFALAGNPNSGKTTMFNALTGASQTVGNWPGVTVEQKSGHYTKDHDISLIDLPGIYSLSPYTAEEKVTRQYLLDERPDVIIDIVDASNLERNLYLTSQLLELACPVVVALNMMDVVKARDEVIDTAVLAKELGCPVVETSALRETNLSEVMAAAKAAAEERAVSNLRPIAFPKSIEQAIWEISSQLTDKPPELVRFLAIKTFERDELTRAALKFSPESEMRIEAIIARAERNLDDDSESATISARYDFATTLGQRARTRVADCESLSAKIDRFVTSRVFGLPIFAAVMFIVYGISVATVGQWLTDFTNDVFVAEWIQEPVGEWLESIGMNEIITGIITEGIIGGVGAILGFLPQMAVLFFFLAILEDCGYMARIAFLLDKLFRRFGLSGKSFIPMLIGTGCGVPGIMAARTVEDQRDRKLTIMTVTFMPCGAKLPLIAMIAGALFDNSGIIAFSAYVLGISSVIATGVMMKKFDHFAGDAAPFVIELPEYHLPSWKNIRQSILNRLSAFFHKAVTVYMGVSILIWVLSSFGFGEEGFGMVEDMGDSIAAVIGHSFAWIFYPLGLDSWQAVIASLLGIAAKEEVVGVLGVFSAIGDADAAMEAVEAVEESAEGMAALAAIFGGDKLAGYSFMVFNLLCAPCFAAMNTIRTELDNWKEALFAIGYECVYAYVVALIIYQLGKYFTTQQFTLLTGVAFALLALLLFLIFRPAGKADESSSIIAATPA